MSSKATAWAWEQTPILTRSEGLMLLAIADNMQPDNQCYPSRKRLGLMCGGLKRDSVSKLVKALEEKGLVKRADRKRDNGSTASTLYTFPLLPPSISTGAPSDSSTGEPSSISTGPELGRSNGNEGTTTDGAVPPSDPTSEEVQSVWDNHQALFPKTRGGLSPSRVRTIEKALKEFPAPDLCKASLGLKHWRKSKEGSTALSAVFSTYPGGRPLADHIAFFIDQGEKAGGDDDLDYRQVRREQGLD